MYMLIDLVSFYHGDLGKIYIHMETVVTSEY